MSTAEPEYENLELKNAHLDRSKPYPLDGILVVDLTRVLSGPTCARMLADGGARVIHVERPPKGDDTRAMGPYLPDGSSEYFRLANVGKESIALDFTDADDFAFLKKLISQADVVVENFRPGVMAKLGIDPVDLVKEHPRLIVASISGFGQYGPMHQQAAYDTIIQALSGVMASTGFPDGPATRVGTSLSDIAAGIFGYCGIVTALVARERTGKGSTVDIAMLDSTFALLEHGLMDALGVHERPERIGNRHPFMYPFDTFECSDQPLAVCVGNNHLWQLFSEALGHPEWPTQEGFVENSDRATNWAQVKAAIESVTTTDVAETWRAKLEAAGVPVGIVLNVDDTRRLPQIIERGMVKVVDGQEVPGSPMKYSTWNSYGAQHDAPVYNANGDSIRAEFDS
ncbi:CoA:oxalate CoA-transferase [Branchiibius hedensis]|uniref:CoA:oxalate CoA-transferase n=1 Tax=Branchiibius hedensis TaxID=672460 RepID=A0A2Y8ZYA1_9MICO|nr:CoA transferase [Branchiibius hedensis]PWJ27448.1 CoA:oxalate CoA-transferase [Branchiibius hedensis]SSA36258.1 CoA:oxalate CoA-transferase [Branchiibius hedensis]